MTSFTHGSTMSPCSSYIFSFIVVNYTVYLVRT